ncbi:TetR/AcrR family transcriptional regulator C-terminal domain-containing protein [Streptosporangium fragile]|uniref:TetR/AcrR family transcriptional regulator C-terminal domain-containing protein n=1 Tax=Streptosporangium fragile TaxID=46186 RepID=A0ABN3W0Y3_9ACTN
MGRPSTPLLSVDLIARAALRIIDTEGSDAVTMSRVATVLGVHTSSLYNHVKNRAALIEEVRTLVTETIDSSAFRTRPWHEAVVEWARSYRTAFARHPRSVPLLMSVPVRAPRVLSMYEDFTVALRRDGWPDDLIVVVLTTVESFILGSVLDMTGPPAMFDPAAHAAEFPAFTEVIATLEASGTGVPTTDRAFELGLDALLRGLREQRRALR